ncbi:MAG: PAS domain S-box protein, partial [Thermodesulfobacteriota bacterium]
MDRNYETFVHPVFDKEENVAEVAILGFDITERKQTEEALRSSEEKYRTILENIEDGYFEVDIAGNFTFFNDSLCRILGYSRDEMIGMNNRQYTDQENAKKLFQAFNKVYRTGEPAREFDWEIIRKDGTKRSIEASVSLIKDPSDNRIGFRGIIRDITGRKQAQETLRESEDRYRDLVENSQDLICTHDLQGNFLSVNPAAAKLLGYDRSTILKMNVRDILVPDVRDQFSSYLDTIRRDGVAKGLMLVQTAAGERRILEYNNTLRTEGVASPIVRAINRDITERRRAEQALRESEERYRTLVETSPDAIALFDLNLNVIMVNRPALTLYGYERQEEVIGKSILGYLVPEEQARAREDIRKVLETGSIGPVEYTLLKKDGIRFPAELKASSILDRQKKPSAILCVSRDITERKRAEGEKAILEEQLRQSQKIEAIGRLAGGIAHDFNNLLTVIKGYSQLSLIE